jgi:GDP-4-dehydro-6-deoxy-D-mannose reductase
MAPERRILILGGAGFVGKHLNAALREEFGEAARVINTSRDPLDDKTLKLDICDTSAVRSIVRTENPTHVINLVGVAAPLEAKQNPDLAWELHALAPERIGHMLCREAPDCWLLHVSSGLIYGRTALESRQIDEKARLDPMDTYAMTKAAGDLAMGVLAGEGLKCLRLRPFNHTGPGQSEDFAMPAFAAQIARIKVGAKEPILHVGNLSATRDFLDVRDVADAYAALIACSDTLKPGAIYNIASGTGHRIEKLLDMLVSISGAKLSIESDPDRQRPSDLPSIVGNSAAIRRDTGWVPKRSIAETLQDTLHYYAGLIKAKET